ncbi:hypothetical protein [Bythopirellula goksoeyrii]|uniref:Glycosyltransferase RgtA/B/C/D-like domain-containing protein n=1 Tax=Bythopirellula goksoeyrii TaxID=1400387 RepID=A0A5B9Q9V5_9BACT|nr:hypothetical protein [Bythopirellula goksoeyrii]QEG34539.1 hypothetical protein Pr1d_18190 [Bythopirellula goksoeyrii]
MSDAMQNTECQYYRKRLKRWAGSNPTGSILLVCFISLLIGWGLSQLHPPVPSVHDEFAYLLSGDTFAEGRLTNPPHPMWQHFETMHVIHQPTYASKYPPGQGVMLALGQVVMDQPIVGVWVMSALGVLASYWMLLGFVPARWAVVGASLLVMLPGYQIYWGQSYWGGTLACIGGALLLGSIPRLQKSLHIKNAIVFAGGALILAVTRPFEGVVLFLLAGGWLVVGWIRLGWPAWRPLVLRFLLPMFGILGAGTWALATYNTAVTGSPFVMPYQVHDQSYGMCPLFLWQAPQEDRQYRHPAMDKFHREWEMPFYRDQQSLSQILQAKWIMLQVLGKILLPIVAAIPLLGILWWRGRNLRGPLIVLCLFWLLTQVTIWNLPHYLAPGLALILLVVVYGLRNLNVSTHQWQWPISPVALLLVGQMLLFVGEAWKYATMPLDDWQYVRQNRQIELSEMAGKQLVFVDYETGHDPLQEWVYNQADIDASKVVWARSMSEEEDLELREFFSDRKAWRLSADADSPNLRPWNYPQVKLDITASR